MSHDQKVMTLLPRMEKYSIDLIDTQGLKEFILLPKFDNSSPCDLRYRDLSNSYEYEVMTSVPPEAGYPIENLK